VLEQSVQDPGVDKFKVKGPSHCGLVLNEMKNNALAHPNNIPL